MQAWLIRSHGGPGVLEKGDVPEPVAGPNDLLIDIRAASVNPIDWKIRNGLVKPLLRYDFPLVLGNDLCGVVTGVGERVHRFKVGDEIYARPDKRRIGCFAERIAIHEDNAAFKPSTLTFGEAASIPLVGLTTWQAMVEIADVKAGQKVLVQAGAGGVGSFAIQFAKYLGAHVASTASETKHELLLSLGADEVIDYRSQDFALLLKDYDVVLDTLGGESLNRSFGVLRQGGIVVSVSGPPDPQFAREWGLPLGLRAGIRLMSYRPRRLARKHGCRYRFLFMEPSGKQLAQIAALIDNGIMRPVIDRVFPFQQADQAIAYAEAGHATGKVIVSRQAEGA